MNFYTFFTAVIITLTLMTFTTAKTNATTVDFNSYPFVSAKTFGTPPAETIITDQYKNLGLVFGKAGVSTGVFASNYNGADIMICGLNNYGFIPTNITGDIYFHFVIPGTDTPGSTDSVSFIVGDEGGDLDIWQIRAFDKDGNMINSQDVFSNSYTTVSINMPKIHSVEIDFTGYYGFFADDITFNTPESDNNDGGEMVPLPAASYAGMALLASLGFIRKIRRK